MPDFEADLFWPSRQTDSSLHARAPTFTVVHVPLLSVTGRFQEAHSSMEGCEDPNPCVAQKKTWNPTVQLAALQILERFLFPAAQRAGRRVPSFR